MNCSKDLKNTFLIGLAGALLCITPHVAFGGGKAVIKPNLQTSWKYDSNYYKHETEENAVSSWAIKPGITVGYETAKSNLMLDGYIKFIDYSDEDDIPEGKNKADNEDYTEQSVVLTSYSQVFKRLGLGLNSTYKKTRDAAVAEDYSNDISRAKYRINQFTPRVVYNFNDQFGIESAYTYKSQDYMDSTEEDSSENRGKFDLFYNLNPRTKVDFDYQVWSKDYDQTTSDYTSNQFMLNLTRRYKTFSFTGGMGYHDRSFDNDAVEDIDAFAWRFAINGQSGTASKYGTPKSRFMAALSSNLNDLGSGEQYYTATRFDLRLSHLFFEKIDTTLFGYFQNSDYEFTDREDDTWKIACDAKYLATHWLSLGTEFGVETRDSNEAGEDYDNYYALIKADLVYNVGARR